MALSWSLSTGKCDDMRSFLAESVAGERGPSGKLKHLIMDELVLFQKMSLSLVCLDPRFSAAVTAKSALTPRFQTAVVRSFSWWCFAL